MNEQSLLSRTFRAPAVTADISNPPQPALGRAGRLLQRFAARRAPLWIVLLALLGAAPALTTDLVADDHYQALILRGQSDLPGVPTSPWDLFLWADGTPEMARAFMESGMIGWWAYPHLKMAYARPLSVLTHLVDHALFADSPVWMHLHTLLWFALALVGLFWLYRRLQAPLDVPGGATAQMIPALSLALFALDDAHGLVLSWVANRNALVALAFALPALALHDCARQPQARRLWSLLSPCCLALALLAGEAALAVCGYLFAYAVCVDRKGVKAGLGAIMPHAAVAIAWALGYRWLGFGAQGSGLAIDPGGEPVRFALALWERLPVLLAAQLAGPPADLWEFYGVVSGGLQQLMWVVIWVVVLLCGWACAQVLRTDAVARFWALGALLAAIPVCAQFPHDRLLLFIGVGAMGLLGRLFVSTLYATESVSRPRRWFVLGLMVVHLVFGPLLLPLRSQTAGDLAKMIHVADMTIPADPGVAERTVVLVNPPIDAYAAYIPTLREATGRPRPEHLHWLATAGSPVTLTTLDDHTLTVRPQGGYLARPSERMQRSPTLPMPVGTQVNLTAMQVTIIDATPEGRPLAAKMHFTAALTDPELQFLAWRDGGYQPFELPAVGQSTTLPAVDFSALLP